MTKKKAGMDPETLARLSEEGNPRPNTYTFEDGTVVHLNRLGEGVLIGLTSDHDKPKAPYRELMMAGGAVTRIARGEDEPLPTEEDIAAIKNPQKREEEEAYRQYRLKLAEWNARAGLRFARTLFLLGVVDTPPPDDQDLWRAIGWSNPHDIKYNWLAYKCRDTNEWEAFINAVISFSMPDQEGIDEMSTIFRSSVPRPPAQTVGTDLGLAETAGEKSPAAG